MFAPYGWSWLGDHSGRRTELLRLSALGALLSALGLMGVQGAVPVAAVVTLIFVANSGMMPLHEALVARLLSSAGSMDARSYGRVRMWGSMGFIASVLGFGALLDLLGIRVFPYFVAAMNGLMLVAALRLPATQASAHHDEPAPPVLPLLRKPEVAWFFASVFFTVLAHNSLYAFFSLYLVDLGYGKAAIGALWAVGVAVEVAFFWSQGRFYGLLTPHRWLQVVAAVCLLRFAATAAFGAFVVVLVLAQLSHAVTFAAHHSSCIALVNKLFPGRAHGRGQALYTTLGYGLSGVLGGVGGGWLISHLGFAAVFWAAALCSVLAWVCATLSARHLP